TAGRAPPRARDRGRDRTAGGRGGGAPRGRPRAPRHAGRPLRPRHARAAAAGGEDAAAAAHGAWEADRFRAEAREPEHELVLGGVRPLAAVLAEPARADEAGAG